MRLKTKFSNENNGEIELSAKNILYFLRFSFSFAMFPIKQRFYNQNTFCKMYSVDTVHCDRCEWRVTAQNKDENILRSFIPSKWEFDWLFVVFVTLVDTSIFHFLFSWWLCCETMRFNDDGIVVKQSFGVLVSVPFPFWTSTMEAKKKKKFTFQRNRLNSTREIQISICFKLISLPDNRK